MCLNALQARLALQVIACLVASHIGCVARMGSGVHARISLCLAPQGLSVDGKKIKEKIITHRAQISKKRKAYLNQRSIQNARLSLNQRSIQNAGFNQAGVSI